MEFCSCMMHSITLAKVVLDGTHGRRRFFEKRVLVASNCMDAGTGVANPPLTQRLLSNSDAFLERRYT